MSLAVYYRAGISKLYFTLRMDIFLWVKQDKNVCTEIHERPKQSAVEMLVHMYVYMHSNVIGVCPGCICRNPYATGVLWDAE